MDPPTTRCVAPGAPPPRIPRLSGVPDDVWMSGLLSLLDFPDLSRLAWTCKSHREHTQAYAKTRAYGLRLAFAGVQQLGASLREMHKDCGHPLLPGRYGLHESVRRHLARVCVRFLELEPPDEPPDDPATPCVLLDFPSIALTDRTVAGRTAEEIIAQSSSTALASFLIPFAAHLGPSWAEASAAVAWGLHAQKLDLLRGILMAPDPCSALLSRAASGQQAAAAHMCLAVRAMEAGGVAPRAAAQIIQAAVGLANTNIAHACKDADLPPATGELQYALACMAIAVNGSQDKVPKGLYHYIRAMHSTSTSLVVARLPCGGPTSRVFRGLGLSNHSWKLDPIGSFVCGQVDIRDYLIAVMAAGRHHH